MLFAAFLVALCHGRAVTHGGSVSLGPGRYAAFAGMWGFFLMLRVIDEHKDFERDAREHPERALQRGVVTLDHLKGVGVFAFTLQALASFALGGRVLVWWALSLGWAALAAKDFFAGRWIAERPVLYPLVHLPLSALPCLWAAQVGAGDRTLPATAGWVALLGVVLAGTVDVVRKLVPDESGERSYAAALGLRRAALALAAALLIASVALLMIVATGTGRTLAAALILWALFTAAWTRLIQTTWSGAAAKAGTTAVMVVMLAQLAATAGLLLAGKGSA
jgi:4-hydroxybenzoate polyprenyltransferase